MQAGVGMTDNALGDDGVLEIDTTISLEITWHAMEDLVSMLLVRSIGIRDCLAYSKIKPAMNQIETHPYFQRDSLVKFCQKHGGLAEKYTKTAAQILRRWGIQRNTVVIPKSLKLERLQENIQVFDFELSKKDMELMESMDKKYRTNQPTRFWGIDLFA
ncbi:hypothetical protein AHAS_Ahas12G0070500 [Arachis hypogaea]|nr:NADP-dependent D-sorbitol-6-phosphate dehydrogenase-like [Arachis hypogaea]